MGPDPTTCQPKKSGGKCRKEKFYLPRENLRGRHGVGGGGWVKKLGGDSLSRNLEEELRRVSIVEKHARGWLKRSSDLEVDIEISEGRETKGTGGIKENRKVPLLA